MATERQKQRRQERRRSRRLARLDRKRERLQDRAERGNPKAAGKIARLDRRVESLKQRWEDSGTVPTGNTTESTTAQPVGPRVRIGTGAPTHVTPQPGATQLRTTADPRAPEFYQRATTGSSRTTTGSSRNTSSTERPSIGTHRNTSSTERPSIGTHRPTTAAPTTATTKEPTGDTTTGTTKEPTGDTTTGTTQSPRLLRDSDVQETYTERTGHNTRPRYYVRIAGVWHLVSRVNPRSPAGSDGYLWSRDGPVLSGLPPGYTTGGTTAPLGPAPATTPNPNPETHITVSFPPNSDFSSGDWTDTEKKALDAANALPPPGTRWYWVGDRWRLFLENRETHDSHRAQTTQPPDGQTTQPPTQASTPPRTLSLIHI